MTSVIFIVFVFCPLHIALVLADDAVKLTIKYDALRPKYVVQPGNKFFVPTGKSFKVECVVSGDSMHPLTANWQSVNSLDGSLSSSQSNVLMFSSVNVSHSGRYDCVVDPIANIPNVSIQLFVSASSKDVKTFGPSNDTVTLSCDLNDPKWTFNGDPIEESHFYELLNDGKKLKIEFPLGKRTGIYACLEDGDQSGDSQLFAVPGIPIVTQHSHTNKNLLEGEKATLKCEVVGYPVATVKWHVHDETTAEDKPLTISERVRLSALEGSLEDSVLTMDDLQFSDAGQYVCVAQNDYGSDQLTIVLRVKDKFAALWPFLGIVAEVAILVVIIFIYEKRRSGREEQSADEEDENNEQKKALTTEETVDVRKREIKT